MRYTPKVLMALALDEIRAAEREMEAGEGKGARESLILAKEWLELALMTSQERMLALVRRGLVK